MPGAQAKSIDAVVFDMDGVLIDSEQVWAAVREEFTRASGGHWSPGAQQAMMGMSSPEWSRYMQEELGVALDPGAISAKVVQGVEERFREYVPVLPGAQEAVDELERRWPLALASSANRPVIDLVLELTGLGSRFQATVSSEEVDHGKPAPDVYLEAARRLGVDPSRCAAIEDSANGLRAASAAGMRLVAIPNAAFPPGADALALADLVLPSIGELRPEAIEGNTEAVSQQNVEIVRRFYEAWERDDFPGPDELMDDGIEYVDPATAVEPGTRRGVSAFTRAVEKTLESWEFWRTELEEVRGSGDLVAVVVSYRARGRESGVEVTGRESALWTVRDGKVVRYEWFHGPDDAFEAIASARPA